MGGGFSYPPPMSKEWTIYFNPKCSKCRGTLELLESKNVEPAIVEYLDDPPDEATLKMLLRKLGLAARALVREKEPGFSDLKLNLDDEAAVVRALVKHPQFLERPIVVRGEKAVLGRPPENVLKLL